MSITGLNLRTRLAQAARAGAIAAIDYAIHKLDPGQPVATPAERPAPTTPPAPAPTPPPAAPVVAAPPPPVATPPAAPAPVATPAPALPPLPTPSTPGAKKPRAPRKKKDAVEPSQPVLDEPVAPPPVAAAAPPPRSTSAEDRQKRHWERTRKGLLQFIAERGGSGTLRELHDHSEQTWFVAHVSFSRLMEELTGEGLLDYDHDTSVATITAAGRAAVG